MAAIASIAACSGCTDWHAWSDVPTAVIEPTAPLDQLPDWTSFVAAQIETWDTALAEVGCPAPFVLGRDGHRVELVAYDRWTMPDITKGYTDDSTVIVRQHKSGTMRVDGTLLHEVGHALGLSHSDPAYGPSLMFALFDAPMPMAPYPRDVAAAACALGCGPCDPAADPYTIE